MFAMIYIIIIDATRGKSFKLRVRRHVISHVTSGVQQLLEGVENGKNKRCKQATVGQMQDKQELEIIFFVTEHLCK